MSVNFDPRWIALRHRIAPVAINWSNIRREHLAHKSSAASSSNLHHASFENVPLESLFEGVAPLPTTSSCAAEAMNSWFDIVRNTPHLKQKFVDVMVNGNDADVEVTQPLSCSLALHLFGALRVQELALTDGIWLYTEHKLAESTPTKNGDVCTWPPLAGFDDLKWPFANCYPSFPASITDIASAALISGAGMSAVNVAAMVSAVDNEAMRVAEEVAGAADRKPPASLVDRWMSHRVNADQEPLGAKRLLDWCFLLASERRALSSCFQCVCSTSRFLGVQTEARCDGPRSKWRSVSRQSMHGSNVA
jgi:hypothetical protein